MLKYIKNIKVLHAGAVIALCVSFIFPFVLAQVSKRAMAGKGGSGCPSQALDQKSRVKNADIYFKRSTANTKYNMQYGFKDHNSQKYKLNYSYSQIDYPGYVTSYGYSPAELAAYDDNKNIQLSKINTSGMNQEQYDQAANNIINQTREAKQKYLKGKGFKGTYNGNTLVIEIDTAGLVNDNAAALKPLAKGINAAGIKSLEGIADASLSMMQLSLDYAEPPIETQSGIRMAGLYPPVQSLVLGEGDCDTKTVVMASILKAWPDIKTIGVRLPTHYLIGIRMVPGPGDAFVKYKNETYVLAEPAGPAWLPAGKVGNITDKLIQSGGKFVIEPY